MIHETFHRFPSVEQSHVVVVKHIAVLIPRILVVPGLKCKWSMNEIEIHTVEPEPIQTRLESRFDALGPAIGVPQLCGNKNAFACDQSSARNLSQRGCDAQTYPGSEVTKIVRFTGNRCHQALAVFLLVFAGRVLFSPS